MGLNFLTTLLEFLMAVGVLPPGFRFHPTDVELVKYYLERKVTGKSHFKAIEELDLYKFAPCDLPERSWLQSGDLEWYFFCPRGRKYRNGQRVNRSNKFGFWKSTGNDRPVYHKSQKVGMIKTLVFHEGQAPGTRTDWVMYEYRLENKDLDDAGILQDAFVLCKIFKKSGPGPKNGEQHGAPFKEEDWDAVNDSLGPFSFSDPGSSSRVPVDDQTIAGENSAPILGNTSSSEHPSQTVSSNVVEEDPSFPNDEEVKALWASFIDEDDLFLPSGNDNNEMMDSSNAGSTVEDPSRLYGYDAYNGLPDLSTRAERKAIEEIQFPKCLGTKNVLDEMLLGDDVYMELDDLESPMQSPVEEISGRDAAIDNPAAPSGEKAEESGNTDAPLALTRGAQHGASYSRVQSLLGSIPARPAIAAEYPSTNEEKIYESSSLLSSYGGSSIHVKADATVQCGCTNNSLSGKLGKSTCVCCHGCNLPRKKFWGAATCSGCFTFVFLLGLVAVLMWVSPFAIGATVCKHARKRSRVS